MSFAVANKGSTPNLYVDLPDFVEIKRDEKRGRGVWSTKSIKRGGVILNLRPHVTLLTTRNLPLYCSFCINPSENGIVLKRCTQCKTVWYCSPVCQNHDWKIHKHECLAIQKWRSSAPDGSCPGEAVRSLGRILWGRKMEGNTSSWWKEIEALQSHRNAIPVSAVESHSQLAHALVRYIGATSPKDLEIYGIHSSGDLVDLISKFSTNSFTLTSPTLSALGTCVSPVAALFNHACLPNAVIVFPRNPQFIANSPGEPKEPLLHVVAINDISPGEEILTAYVDASLPKPLRQQALKETYNFVCICTLCVTPNTGSVDPREALWCPKSCGGMCPAPTNEDSLGTIARCTSCKAQFTLSAMEDVKDKLRIGQEALEKATSLEFSDPTGALKLTSNIIPLLSSQVPPSAYPLLPLLLLHQTLLISSPETAIDPSLLDKAIRSSARTVSGLMSVFVEGHPVRGIRLAELGKLLAVDEPPPLQESASTRPVSVQSDGFPPSGAARLALAIDTLKRALRELRIGFGETTEGGVVGVDVRDTVIKLEDEMNVYKRGMRNIEENMRGNSR